MMIPLIAPLQVDNQEIDRLMQIGFCYVPLPNVGLVPNIQTCMQVANEFFQSNQKNKEKWQLKKTLKPGDRYQGYVLRSQSKNTNAIEQIFFEPDAPFGPYTAYSSLIHEIDATFRNLIFLPLMRAIFNRLELKQSDFTDATNDPYCSLVFQSYPFIDNDRNVIRLNAHKDFGLLTVVYFEEPGLQVNYQNQWQSIPPKKDCVVVNLGNALESMTGKRCRSALHRVINATDNRISMVYFFTPNSQNPVRNYIDKTVIAKSGELFFKQQFTEYYEVDL